MVIDLFYKTSIDRFTMLQVKNIANIESILGSNTIQQKYITTISFVQQEGMNGQIL